MGLFSSSKGTVKFKKMNEPQLDYRSYLTGLEVVSTKTLEPIALPLKELPGGVLEGKAPAGQYRVDQILLAVAPDQTRVMWPTGNDSLSCKKNLNIKPGETSLFPLDAKRDLETPRLLQGRGFSLQVREHIDESERQAEGLTSPMYLAMSGDGWLNYNLQSLPTDKTFEEYLEMFSHLLGEKYMAEGVISNSLQVQDSPCFEARYLGVVNSMVLSCVTRIIARPGVILNLRVASVLHDFDWLAGRFDSLKLT